MKNFKDKVVVITGGATGIGFSFAKQFAKEGATIIVSGRRQEKNLEAVSKLQEMGHKANAVSCDVTDIESVNALADFAWEKYGKVDVLINNAGMMTPHAPVLDMPIEHIQAIFNVNLFGVINGSKVFGKRFIEQGSPAAIYNVGSENSLFHGTPFNGAYVATKHSVMAFTESLYEELPDFIDISLICPGFVYSELGPEENMKLGMPTDEYTDVAMKQIKAGEFYVVSHAYNMVPIEEKFKKISKAFSTYAPRYEGDERYHVRNYVTPLLEEQIGRKLRKIK